MHELSIAQNILDIVRQHVDEADLASIRSVRVVVGAASGVVADSLAFSFEAIVAGTSMSSAKMEIERIPFRLYCSGCGATSQEESGFHVCPRCGSSETKVISGTELRVKDIELADGD
jgi:hydrogenase nickel incorporation protein HypA/HybF